MQKSKIAIAAGVGALTVTFLLLLTGILQLVLGKNIAALAGTAFTWEMMLFDLSYGLTILGVLLVYLARSEVRALGKTGGGVIALILADFLMLSFTSELAASSPLADRWVLALSIILGADGMMLVFFSFLRPWRQIFVFPFLVAGGITVMGSLLAYGGHIHLATYYGSGLQRPLAVATAVIGVSFIVIAAIATQRLRSRSHY